MVFSNSIQNLISTSGADAAKKRAVQLEFMITARKNDLELPQHLEKPEFSDFLKVNDSQLTEKLKFQVQNRLPEINMVRPQTDKSEIESIVQEASIRFKVDKKLLMAVIQQESAFNPDAVSSAGAKGLMQLMPATAQSLGVKDVFDPYENVMGGAKYLKSMLNKYNGNIVLALAAYNSGSGNVSKYNGVPPFGETQDYVKKILSNYLG